MFDTQEQFPRPIMNEYTLLILFALLAIAFSFLCSLWESVLLSISPSYAHIEEEKGTPVGRQLQNFKANIDVPLSAILTLNTIAHTVGAIGVGNQASQIWAESNPLVTGLVVPALMTLAILILSEIIPKTLGANYWKEFTSFTVYSLAVLVKILAPLVWATQLITRSLRKDGEGAVFTRHEFLAMTDMGAKEGVFDPWESEIIRNLLRFNTVKARDVMTPRTVTRMAAGGMKVSEFHEKYPNLRFSRIPLYSDSDRDEVFAYVRKDDVLRELASGEPDKVLEDMARDILVVLDNYPITELFNHFLQKREHIALVVNEFGSMAGIVTLEDVLETMLGLEIVDELDATEDMQLLARKNWEQRAEALGILQPENEA